MQPDEDGEIYKKIRKTIEPLCKKIYNTVTKTIKDLNLTNKELRTRRYGFDERHR